MSSRLSDISLIPKVWDNLESTGILATVILEVSDVLFPQACRNLLTAEWLTINVNLIIECLKVMNLTKSRHENY